MQNKQQKENKVYVGVEAKFATDGTITPTAILWEDGKVYSIDKVIDVRPCCSLHIGGAGLRYTVKIGGNVRYLFCEGQNYMKREGFCRWFISKESY